MTAKLNCSYCAWLMRTSVLLSSMSRIASCSPSLTLPSDMYCSRACGPESWVAGCGGRNCCSKYCGVGNRWLCKTVTRVKTQKRRVEAAQDLFIVHQAKV